MVPRRTSCPYDLARMTVGAWGRTAGTSRQSRTVMVRRSTPCPPCGAIHPMMIGWAGHEVRRQGRSLPLGNGSPPHLMPLRPGANDGRGMGSNGGDQPPIAHGDGSPFDPVPAVRCDHPMMIGWAGHEVRRQGRSLPLGNGSPPHLMPLRFCANDGRGMGLNGAGHHASGCGLPQTDCHHWAIGATTLAMGDAAWRARKSTACV